ncbi:MAG: hypothetical protein GX799_03050 [Crenarchaeota archaeon]|nr:hypothetical protein [Thermoproteota archaeon]
MIIAVASGKGGTSKASITTSLTVLAKKVIMLTVLWMPLICILLLHDFYTPR